MDWSLLIAIIAAIGAAFANGWNFIRDRRKLLVEAFFGYLVPSEEEKMVFYMVITNIGKRPVYVSNLGGSYKKGGKSFNILPRYPQKMLKEGESHMEYSEDIVDKLIDNIDNIENIFAIDSLKKKWKISSKNMSRLKKDAEDIKKEIKGKKRCRRYKKRNKG